MIRPNHDVIVVGGSFAGLSAAMQLARARRRVLVVDAGLPRNRVAAASHGFFGHDGRAPLDLLALAREGVLRYPTVELAQSEVTDARGATDAFSVTLASGATAAARRLVLATGVRDELPDVPGLRERWGASVLHCPYCHGYEVADRRLGVLAVSEGSVHHALLLPDWSADVTLFLNGAFEPTDEQRRALRARGVRIEERMVSALRGELPSLEAVQLADGETVGLDALFTASYTTPIGTLAEQLGCELVAEPHGTMVRVDARQRTSVSGVFAAGDLTRFPHNATWASSDGVMAGVAAHQSLVMG